MTLHLTEAERIRLRGRLVDILKTNTTVLTKERGPKPLSSGLDSYVYVNLRDVLSRRLQRSVVDNLLLDAVQQNYLRYMPDLVGGMATGSIYPAHTLMYYAEDIGLKLDMFTVRPEATKEGAESTVEGPLVSTRQVLVVDDVITTGQAVYKVLQTAQARGAAAIGVLCVLDRSFGLARAILKRADVKFVSLVRLEDLVTPLVAERERCIMRVLAKKLGHDIDGQPH